MTKGARKKRVGRPALPEADRKSRNFTFRSRGDLREHLERAAQKAGRSISEEIENRLERSFLDQAAYDRAIVDFFGGERTFYLIQHIGMAIKKTSADVGYLKDEWADHPELFQKIQAAINDAVAEWISPDNEFLLWLSKHRKVQP